MDAQLQTYLRDVLGTAVADVKPCVDAYRLPYFLQDEFNFLTVHIAGTGVVLAIPKPQANPSLKNIRAQLARAEAELGHPVAYCPPALASYERRNLIEQKQAFIVAGNQMYLPDIGIDLREYFSKARTKKIDVFSPSTQAMLIWRLLNHPVQQQWYASDVGTTLGYSLMTANRAIRELESAELVESEMNGHVRVVKFLHTNEQIWQKAQPYLKTPVKRSVWIKPPKKSSVYRLAGLSALAQKSNLASPSETCYAMSGIAWTKLQNKIDHLPQAVPGLSELQLWSYQPDMVGKSTMVDPLSLWISLKEDVDPRIQMALDEMMREIVW